MRLHQSLFHGSPDEFGVPEPMPKHKLEVTNGVEVLRRPRIPTRHRSEAGQDRSAEIGEFSRSIESDLSCDLEADDASHDSIDEATLGEAEIPRVALEPLLAEGKDRSPLASAELTEHASVL